MKKTTPARKGTLAKKIVSHLAIALACTAIGTAIWLYRANLLFPVQPVPFEPEPQSLYGDDLLDPEEMREDLAYMLEVIESVHPDPHNRLGEEGWKAEKLALLEKTQEPLTAAQFYFALKGLVTSVGDAHTVLRFDEQDKGLGLTFDWVQEGLVLAEDYGPFRTGDLILTIGGKRPEELLPELDRLVSSETMYWVREESKTLLRRRPVLDHLGLVDGDGVSFVVDREGGLLTLTAFLEADVQRRSLEDLLADRHGWHVNPEEGLAVFYLNVCIYDEVFMGDVREFFAAVKTHGIGKVALDLRGNVGGDSRVTGTFLQHLPVSRYKTYGTLIRYSPLAAERVGVRRTGGTATYPPSTRKVTPVREPFEGPVYVLVGNQTFSSGNWIAVILYDNELAEVLGEPTGNAPSSYGDMLSFQLPHTRFLLGVSYKYFTRPDPSKDPQNALYPHIPIPKTRQDVIDGIDPVFEYLRSITAY